MLLRNVLIFHSGALGDFVLTFPLALSLARVYPQSRIFFVTTPGRGALVDAMLRLEWIDAEAGWHALFGPNPQLRARSLSLLSGASTVFALTAPPPLWLDNVRAINPHARLITIDPRVPDDFAEHQTQWMLQQLEPHRVEHEATSQILRSLQSRGLASGNTGGGGVLIHPGAGARDKCWPLHCFIELGKRLVDNGQQVRFVIGEVERERWSNVDLSNLRTAFETAEPQSLIDLHKLQTSADVFIGNDSGPAHLSGMMGIPTLALFGPTRSTTWHPLGPHTVIVSGEPMSAISVDQVERQACDLLAVRG